MPRIVFVAADEAPLTLRVRWDEADESRIDISGLVGTFRAYEPLRHSPELFARARVGEHGADVVWFDEIDMSADMLWRLAREQTAPTMSSEPLRQLRERDASVARPASPIPEGPKIEALAAPDDEIEINGMEHADFKIGVEFFTATGRWRVTDVGTRTVIAIKLDQSDPRNYNGPPYSIVESVFDEYDFGGCEPAKARMTTGARPSHDMSSELYS